MRIAIAVFCVLASTPAFADDVTGTYDVKFETMASDCNPPPVALGRGKLTIGSKKGSLTLDVSPLPQLAGGESNEGKVTFKSNRVFGTTVVGLLAKYSATGDAKGGKIDLLLIADYIKQTDSKPYCKQSWKVTGDKKK
jgi:hypothetical protein